MCRTFIRKVFDTYYNRNHFLHVTYMYITMSLHNGCQLLVTAVTRCHRPGSKITPIYAIYTTIYHLYYCISGCTVRGRFPLSPVCPLSIQHDCEVPISCHGSQGPDEVPTGLLCYCTYYTLPLIQV